MEVYPKRKEEIKEVLSKNGPMKSTGLLNKLVIQAGNIDVTYDYREAIFDMIFITEELILSPDRRLFLNDHTRGICHEPDVPANTPQEYVKENPAHCTCCGSKMKIRELTSMEMQQLGMYALVCPTCP